MRNPPKKNLNAKLAGSGLPRTSTALPERESPEVIKRLKAFIRQRALEPSILSGQSTESLTAKLLAISSTGIKRRGRPRKEGGAQTAAERKRKERERAKATEQQRLSDAEALRVIEDSPDTAGRHKMESTKSPADLDKIFRAKARSGQVVQDEMGRLQGYDQTDYGRQVKPSGHGKDNDQEGFFFTRGATGSSAQANNGQSRCPKWGTTQEQQVRTHTLEDFQTEHLYPVLYCPLDNHNQIQAWLRCDLCHTDDHENQDEIVSSTITWDADGEEIDDLDEPMSWTDGLEWGIACGHLEDVHGKDLQKALRETMPAWMSPARERQLMGKKKCPVDHERHRQEAIKRKEPDEIKCGVPYCRHVIYNPKRDLPNFRDTIKSHQP